MGPVLQVVIVCCLDQYGIEIQVPSMSDDGTKSWIIKSRGPNPNVEELPYHDRDNSPENQELVNLTNVGRPHAILSNDEQPFWRLCPDRQDIIAYGEVKGRTLEYRNSKR